MYHYLHKWAKVHSKCNVPSSCRTKRPMLVVWRENVSIGSLLFGRQWRRMIYAHRSASYISEICQSSLLLMKRDFDTNPFVWNRLHDLADVSRHLWGFKVLYLFLYNFPIFSLCAHCLLRIHTGIHSIFN